MDVKMDRKRQEGLRFRHWTNWDWLPPEKNNQREPFYTAETHFSPPRGLAWALSGSSSPNSDLGALVASVCGSHPH